MSEQIKEKVLSLLKNYPEMSRRIAALRYELAHPVRVSPQEMLEAMVFHRGEEGSTANTSDRDKTYRVAVHFRQKAEQINREAVRNTLAELHEMEQERDRLLRFISLLDEREATVIRMAYLERRKVAEICGALDVTEKTVLTAKKHGIAKLCELYMLTAPIRA